MHLLLRLPVQLCHYQILLLGLRWVFCPFASFLSFQELQIIEAEQVYVREWILTLQGSIQRGEVFEIRHWSASLSCDVFKITSFEFCLPTHTHLSLILDGDLDLFLRSVHSDEDVESTHLHLLLFLERQREWLRL